MDVVCRLPMSGQKVEISFDEDSTADEVIDALVDNGLMAPPQEKEIASLAINGGGKISGSQRLADAGVTNGSIIDVLVNGFEG